MAHNNSKPLYLSIKFSFPLGVRVIKVQLYLKLQIQFVFNYKNISNIMIDELLKNIIYAAIGAATVIFNSLEISLIVKRWRETKPYEQLLLNLAIADILVGGIRFITALYGIYRPDWKEGTYYIALLGFKKFSVSSSVFNIFAISADRLIAVKFPLKHRVWMSKRNTRTMNASTWILTFLFTLVCILFTLNAYGRAMFLATAVILFIGAALLIIHAVLIKSIMTRPNFTLKAEQSHFHFGRRWERKVVLTCTLFVAVYFACTWPGCFEILQCKKIPCYLDFSKTTLLFLNSLINPCLYFFKDYLRRKHKQERKTNGNLNDKSGTAMRRMGNIT